MHYKIVLVLICIGLTALFIIQNVAVAEIRFLFWSVQMSRSLLLFFLVALGMVIGWFLHSFFIHRGDKDI
jgi:putative membrane protein